MAKFGYQMARPRSIQLDRNEFYRGNAILHAMPELQTCIGCGSCTATCTAGALTDFNFRRLHTMIRRGEFKAVEQEVNKCMLCGKCRMTCPRGINTRGVILLIRRALKNLTEE